MISSHPIDEAVKKNHRHVAKQIMQHPKWDKWFPLQPVAERDDASWLMELIALGLWPQLRPRRGAARIRWGPQCSEFLFAVYSGHGVPVNAIDDSCKTSDADSQSSCLSYAELKERSQMDASFLRDMMSAAIERGHDLHLIKRLLELGADVNALPSVREDEWERPVKTFPLDEALAAYYSDPHPDNLELVELLVNASANISWNKIHQKIWHTKTKTPARHRA